MNARYIPAACQAVDHFVKWAKDLGEQTKPFYYPNEEKSELFKRGYIAESSGHSRASTIDLTIVPVDHVVAGSPSGLNDCRMMPDVGVVNDSIPMGTAFDCFDELSSTEHPKITGAPKLNRLLLKTLMEKHGFKNYDKEWWHYTLAKEPYPSTRFNFPVE